MKFQNSGGLMPRPRKPTALLELNGAFDKNPQRRRKRQHEPKPENPLGSPPMHLRENEMAVWLELSEQLPAGVATSMDRAAFELVTCLLVQFRQHRESMTGSQMTLLATLLGRFGMNPADRSRVAIPQVKSQYRDPLDEFLARSAERKLNAVQSS
jgi:phage terminase small subunit